VHYRPGMSATDPISDPVPHLSLALIPAEKYVCNEVAKLLSFQFTG